MRAYGLPRHGDVEFPDRADISLYGLSTKHGKLKSSNRRSSRRIWKKKERARVRRELEEEENA